MDNSKYWNKRAKIEYKYKGEKFYTITPIPYYYMRRKIILKKLSQIIKNNKYICDFGCGDGEYIKLLQKEHPECCFHGVDISPEMIQVAISRIKSNKVTFECSGEGLKNDFFYNVIYSSAVFAHIKDDYINHLFQNIFNHISENGSFVLCEQTAPYLYSGDGFIRRPASQYITLLNNVGFNKIDYCIIDFWAHRLFFERLVGKLFVNIYLKKHKETEKQIALVNLNNNIAYKFLSKIFATISIPRIFHKEKKWGYCFIVARKE